MEMLNKKVWSKTKVFRTALAISAIVMVAFWIVWLVCDTIFLKTGINFDGGKLIPFDNHWYNVAYWMSCTFVLLTICFFASEIAYIVYRSFAIKTDRNKVIYECVVHGIIAFLVGAFNTINAIMLFENSWIAAPIFDGSFEIYDINLFHIWFVMSMGAVALSAIFSCTSLFQANKAFKFYNLYFDFSLVVVILAIVSIPLYIASICLMMVHPSVQYPYEFWLHISGQCLYYSFTILKYAMIIFLAAKLILLIRLNDGQLKRTKRAIVIAAVLVVLNVIASIATRIASFSVEQIFYNKNWITQITIISISFVCGIISGWNSCYRYIELYAKPSRKLEQEPLILN